MRTELGDVLWLHPLVRVGVRLVRHGQLDDDHRLRLAVLELLTHRRNLAAQVFDSVASYVIAPLSCTQ